MPQPVVAVGNNRSHLWCQMTQNTAVPVIPVSAQEMSTMKNWWSGTSWNVWNVFDYVFWHVWLAIMKRGDTIFGCCDNCGRHFFFKLIDSAIWQHLCFYPCCSVRLWTIISPGFGWDAMKSHRLPTQKFLTTSYLILIRWGRDHSQSFDDHSPV